MTLHQGLHRWVDSEECGYVACVPKWIRRFGCTVDMRIKWVKLKAGVGISNLKIVSAMHVVSPGRGARVKY